MIRDYIKPGSLRESEYIESFNGKLRDELLNTEIFRYAVEGEDADRTLADRVQYDLIALVPGMPAPEAIAP